MLGSCRVWLQGLGPQQQARVIKSWLGQGSDLEEKPRRAGWAVGGSKCTEA